MDKIDIAKKLKDYYVLMQLQVQQGYSENRVNEDYVKSLISKNNLDIPLNKFEDSNRMGIFVTVKEELGTRIGNMLRRSEYSLPNTSTTFYFPYDGEDYVSLVKPSYAGKKIAFVIHFDNINAPFIAKIDDELNPQFNFEGKIPLITK